VEDVSSNEASKNKKEYCKPGDEVRKKGRWREVGYPIPNVPQLGRSTEIQLTKKKIAILLRL